MSVDEMKIEAINKVMKLDTEVALKEVIEHLDSLNSNKTINLSANYVAIKEQYGDVLQKLAQ